MESELSRGPWRQGKLGVFSIQYTAAIEMKRNFPKTKIQYDSIFNPPVFPCSEFIVMNYKLQLSAEVTIASVLF